MSEFEKEAEIPPERLPLERVLACVEQGWAVFPVAPNAKNPMTKNGFKDASKSSFGARKLFSKHDAFNIGIATGEASGIVVIDVDVKKDAKGRESLASLHGLPPTLTVSTPSGGWHLYFLYPEGGLRSKNGILPGIDLKANGGYVLAAGSSIDGKPYDYLDPEAPIAALPEHILALLRDSIGNGRRAKTPPVAESITDGKRNSTLASLAGTMRRRGMQQEEIEAALKAVNGRRCDPPLPEKEVEKVAASISSYPSPQGDVLPPGFTEDALALEFTSRYGEDWRYVANWGSWLNWSGKRWMKEATLRVFDLARRVCREASSRCQKSKIAAKIASAATVAAVEKFARADRKHAAAVEQWDSQPSLINTQGSVFDIRTGRLREHRREDYITKITSGSITQAILDAELADLCPTWLRFLDDVTARDEDLQRYLARLAGYALTGDTSEHALGFLYGTGANGKSVFLNTLAATYGDYAMTAAMDTFLESKTDRHPTDLAGLRGARLVISIEVDKGRRWAESKIKSLTGGDTIAARFMRQDFFEYTPQFKLLVAGNNKPALRDVDEAMKRRLHLIPFTVTIPPERRDKTLGKKLLKERDGILRWAIEGCMEWQKIGLKPPACVVSATEEYFEAEDGLGRWIAEACVTSPNTKTRTTELFASWKQWSERAGEFSGSLKSFSQTLSKRGFRKLPGRYAGFIGLAPADGERQGDML